MELSILDRLDEEQLQLDQKKAEARKAVLAEIQRLISRIDAKPSELHFSSEDKPRRSRRRRAASKDAQGE